MHKTIFQAIENKILSSDEIIGIFYTGSTATGKFDEFSDLDIYLVTNSCQITLIDNLLEFISSRWAVRFFNKTMDSLSVYIQDDFFKLEIHILGMSDLKPGHRMKDARIVKDQNDSLSQIKKISQSWNVKISYEDITNFFIDQRESQLYVARHTARGWKWSAMGDANYQGEQLFYLLARLKGRLQYGFREAEYFLTAEELKLLSATRCHTPETQEIYRAMKANWTFMKYIEDYYNNQNSKKLKISTPDQELLDYINELYLRARSVDYK